MESTSFKCANTFVYCISISSDLFNRLITTFKPKHFKVIQRRHKDQVSLPLNSGQSDGCISYWDPPKYEVSPPCLRVCLWASFKRNTSSCFNVQSPTALQTINLSWELRNIIGRGEEVDEYLNHTTQTSKRIQIQQRVLSKKIVFTSPDQMCSETTVHEIRITVNIIGNEKERQYECKNLSLQTLLYTTSTRPHVYAFTTIASGYSKETLSTALKKRLS